MKIQCDVCSRDEASVFCGADEAALCAACDRRVHHANKLAVKHQRFSLLRCRPNNGRDDDERQPLPLCDVCQELRAFLFCQQDRAILCRECDLAIHAANQRTANHSRFVLTGAVLSSTPITPSSDDDSSSSSAMNHHHREKPTSETTITDPPETENGTDASATKSEFLMAMLPGWRAEDFLDFPDYTPYGFCENDDYSSQFLDADLESGFGFWGPEPPPPPPAPPQALQGIKDSKNSSSLNTNRRPREDAFTVPQFSPPSMASNRARNSAFSDLN